MSDNYIVCDCHNVTLGDIKQAIKDGVTTFEALQERTNIATDCPPCKTENLARFEQLLLENE